MNEINNLQPLIPIPEEETKMKQPTKFMVELKDNTLFEFLIDTKDPNEMTNWEIIKEFKNCVENLMNIRNIRYLDVKKNNISTLLSIQENLRDRCDLFNSLKSNTTKVNDNKFVMNTYRLGGRYIDDIDLTGFNSITETTIIRQKDRVKKDGKVYSGWRISFASYCYAVYSPSHKPETTAAFKKEYKHVLLVNETPDGIRLMWCDNKKRVPLWGRSYRNIKEFANDLMASNTIGRAIESVYELMETIYTQEQVLPILEYWPVAKNRTRKATTLQLYDVPQRHLKLLSTWRNEGQSIKTLLNQVYGKSGLNGLTKNAFGGLNKIDTLKELTNIIETVKIFKNFPPSFFDQMTWYGTYWEQAFDGANADRNRFEYFVKTFTFNQKTKTISTRLMEDMLICVSDNQDYDISEAHSRLIASAIDCSVMLKLIPVGRARNTIVQHVKDHKFGVSQIHEHLVIESRKYNQEDIKLVYPKQMQQFNNTEILPGISFHTADTSHTLIEWGGKQNNCIGSYRDRIVSKETYVVGFKNIATDEWIGHSSLNGTTWESTQLLGKFNRSLDPKDHKSITKWMNQNLQRGQK